MIDAAIRDISPAAFKVWFVLGDWCRENAISHYATVKGKKTKVGTSDGCYPAISSIAAKVGMSDRHVQNCLKELEAKGWVRRDKQSSRKTWLYSMPMGFPSTRRWYALAVLGKGLYPGSEDDE